MAHHRVKRSARIQGPHRCYCKYWKFLGNSKVAISARDARRLGDSRTNDS